MPDNTKPKTGGPSLRPTEFAHELPDISKYSLESVVAMFKDTEKKRNLKTEPDDQAEVHWRIRSSPRELLSSIRVVAAHLGVSRAVLTRCMSHQIADWLSNALGLDSLEREYTDIYNQIKLQAYSTLRIQAENPARFSFVGPKEATKTSISTIQWVVNKASQISEFLGLDVGDILTLGFLWSLTTLEHREWDENTIDRFFLPEVFNFETLVADRKVDVWALRMKYENRESTNYNSRIYPQSKSTSQQVHMS